MAKQNARDKKVALFVQGAKRPLPPDQWYMTKTPRMPGPKDRGPNDNQTFLGQKAAGAGAYKIPGFGEWARQQNIAKYRQRHAFNPGRNPNNRTWS